MVAAREWKLEIVEYLLNRGADVDAVEDYDAKSAVHFAAQNGHSGVIRLLSESGAQIDLGAMPMGETPVIFAAAQGHMEQQFSI